MEMLKDNYTNLHNAAIEKLQDILNNVVSEFLIYSNTDEKDLHYYSKLPLMQLHISHAIGELIEAKSQICELDSTEQLLIKAYEQEMDNLLSTYNKSMDYSQLLENDE